MGPNATQAKTEPCRQAEKPREDAFRSPLDSVRTTSFIPLHLHVLAAETVGGSQRFHALDGGLPGNVLRQVLVQFLQAPAFRALPEQHAQEVYVGKRLRQLKAQLRGLFVRLAHLARAGELAQRAVVG